MESAFEYLQLASEDKEYKSFSDLEIGKYRVECFKIFQSKFGQRLVVFLDEKTYVYLPQRYFEVISTNAQVMELNRSQYIMDYQGKDPKKKNRIIVDFIKETSDDNKENEDTNNKIKIG